MTLGSALLTNWNIANLDKGEELSGDFEAQDVTRNVSVSYTEHFTLSRENPIIQFVHGNTDSLTFTGRFFLDPAILSLGGLPFVGVLQPAGIAVTQRAGRFSLRPAEKLSKLEEWITVDPDLGRPPIVLFSIGEELSQISVIESVNDIRYDRPLITGGVRGVTFTVTLRKFVAFDIELASRPPPESRYHHVKEREYYELIAEREYGTPILGDVVRKRHPDKAVLHKGDVIKLPSITAIQTTQVVPRSIALSGLTQGVPSPQRTLRQVVLDRLNRSRFSPTVPEGV